MTKSTLEMPLETGVSLNRKTSLLFIIGRLRVFLREAGEVLMAGRIWRRDIFMISSTHKATTIFIEIPVVFATMNLGNSLQKAPGA